MVLLDRKAQLVLLDLQESKVKLVLVVQLAVQVKVELLEVQVLRVRLAALDNRVFPVLWVLQGLLEQPETPDPMGQLV